MPVSTMHPEYIANVKDWVTIENVVVGNAKQYIPDIEAIYPFKHPLYDPSRQWIAIRSCDLYRDGARFSNFALQTVDSIVGLATNCPPKTFELPPELEYLKENATGDDLDIDQLIQFLLKETVKKGRVGLFTDFPNVEEGLTKEQTDALGAVPRMYTFPAESIINWDTTTDSGVGKLSRVVIKKMVKAPNQLDRFTWKLVPQYLVLELDKDGIYTQSEYDRSGNVVPGTIENFMPKANGKYLKTIPFSFIGSENNNPKVDVPPLKSIVELNIGHLRCSAIYMDNLKKYGRGTLAITSSLETDEWKAFYENRPIVLGTEEGYYFGAAGGMEIVQLQPAQEAAVAMTQFQDQMVMLGAHIVVANPANISENTTRLNMGNKISMLSVIVGNVEDALELHFGYCADFLGANKNLIEFEMSTDFIEKVADPLIMSQLLAQFNAALIPASVALDYNKSVGLLSEDCDYDELQTEIDNANPIPVPNAAPPVFNKPPTNPIGVKPK